MTKQILLFSSLFVFSVVQPMENNAKKTYMVYSHGFGEDRDCNDKVSFKLLGDYVSMPVYPDAPGQLNKAVFYTKPAVHKLVNHLHKIAEKDDCESIRLVGSSCGAGTAINCLAKLAHYDKNRDYFNGSNICSKEDADNIMQKINNGAFVATAPFLHVRKANAIATAGKILAGATIVGATGAACYFGPSLCKDSVDPEVARWGFVAAGVATYYAFGDYIKKMWAQGIVYTVVPCITNKHFDPHHESPLQSVEQLRGKLTCPKLLHFKQQDGFLENPDEDTVKVYDALKSKNTHIIITSDASHIEPSDRFNKELEKFNKKYLQKNIAMRKENFLDWDTYMEDTQPTVKDLRKQIQDQQTFMGNNAFYLGGAAMAGTAVGMLSTTHRQQRIEYCV